VDQNNFALGCLFFGSFWTKAASMLSLPFLAIYLFQNTHFAPWLIGFIIGCQPFSGCISGFFGGYFSDHFDRIQLIILSLLISTTVYFGFYFTAALNFRETDKVILFCIFNLINGLSSSIYSPISQAIISDLTSPDNKVKSLQMRYMCLNTGAAIGPVIGAYAGVASGEYAFFLTAILYAIFSTIFWLGLKNKIPMKSKVSEKIKVLSSIKLLIQDRKFTIFIISSIFFTAAYSQIESNLSLVIKSSFTNGIIFFSWMLSLNAAAVVIMQPPVYWFVRNLTPKKVVFIGSLIFSITCMMAFSLHPSKSLYVFFILLITLGEVLVIPTQSVITDSLAPAGKQGLYFGASTLRQLGYGIGPILGGLTLQIFSGHFIFLLMFILVILSSFLDLVLG
jgi:MFS family permease